MRELYEHAQSRFRFSLEEMIEKYRAKRSEQVHHMNKRRGEMLNEERFWLAVCRENHERIEQNLGWARANGFSLNF